MIDLREPVWWVGETRNQQSEYLYIRIIIRINISVLLSVLYISVLLSVEKEFTTDTIKFTLLQQTIYRNDLIIKWKDVLEVKTVQDHSIWYTVKSGNDRLIQDRELPTKLMFSG